VCRDRTVRAVTPLVLRASAALRPGRTNDRGIIPMSPTAAKSIANAPRLHPLTLRIMHWINAAAIFIMIGSGWRIYNDDVIFGWLHFPDFLVIGKWAQYGLQWHFFGMWIFVLNGLAYLTYGVVTGRFRQKLFPISLRDVFATMRDALHFHLSHDDLTVYNAVQKILYLGVILIGVLIVITGLCLWKPVQFSELAGLFGSFQVIRVIHFLCMSAIVAFVLVHVALAVLVPQSLLAMLTGGPTVGDALTAKSELRPAAEPAAAAETTS
jgi:thiosulfate reductase cytochrome b subunit